ncbi:Protein C05D11.5, partial [Aphelenchoides avenae]
MISLALCIVLFAACCIAQPGFPDSYLRQAQSRIRVSAHLDFQFTDVPLLERYEVAAKLGFKLVELTPYDVRPEQLRAAANKYGLQHVMINAPLGNFSAGERGLAALPGQVQRFRESIETAIHYAKVLGAK